jgi:hypothetical protein
MFGRQIEHFLESTSDLLPEKIPYPVFMSAGINATQKLLQAS